MKRDRELAAAVEELAAADTLAFGGVGIAGTLLPATEAYQQLERALAERPAEVRQRLDRLLEHGSPAGKAYAAALLDTVDHAAGRAAWTRLRDDPGELTTFTGCLMDQTTLGEYAAERLAGQ
ncbi:hypothetical protein GA0074695_0276 [Micromonospora viridifaciens]|uniref:Uncharacterized protein n=1 Tax=Micromonospora viridifaciens TaxID=1881 RepID=A0A1C4U9C9_MICVI|nr:hypothetical protein [Micromonospora viridifaciens]SCE68262.1 hypothetical protein GA0074695_0276 [Micromonospora viridifaciens]